MSSAVFVSMPITMPSVPGATFSVGDMVTATVEGAKIVVSAMVAPSVGEAVSIT